MISYLLKAPDFSSGAFLIGQYVYPLYFKAILPTLLDLKRGFGQELDFEMGCFFNPNGIHYFSFRRESSGLLGHHLEIKIGR